MADMGKGPELDGEGQYFDSFTIDENLGVVTPLAVDDPAQEEINQAAVRVAETLILLEMENLTGVPSPSRLLPNSDRTD